MILQFKEYFDKEKQNPTYFAEKICVNDFILKNEYDNWYIPSFLNKRKMIKVTQKLHTIRVDKNNRIKKGTNLQCCYWAGRPYYSKNIQFAPTFECKSTQKIDIIYRKTTIENLFTKNGFERVVLIDNKYINYETLSKLAINDGFDNVNDFFAWFNCDFEGKIIHFTDLKY